MTTILLMAVALVLAVIALAHTRSAPSVPAPSLATDSRSAEHAARLLAGRYARGEITVSEYRRMLLVLKP